jgi:hypothetical protein
MLPIGQVAWVWSSQEQDQAVTSATGQISEADEVKSWKNMSEEVST